jgi:hypothetical protein
MIGAVWTAIFGEMSNTGAKRICKRLDTDHAGVKMYSSAPSWYGILGIRILDHNQLQRICSRLGA